MTTGIKLAPRGAKVTSSHTYKPCIIGRLIADLDNKSAKDFIEQLEDSKEQHTEISQRLRDNGISINVTSVGHHRRRRCYCPPTVRNTK